MKTPAFGTVAIAILYFLAGIGFGIAQAGVMHSDNPASRIGGKEDLQVTNTPDEKSEREGPIVTGSLSSWQTTDSDDIDSEDQGEYSLSEDDVDSRDQGENTGSARQRHP